jgi:outer membrane protein assembly factor BamA
VRFPHAWFFLTVCTLWISVTAAAQKNKATKELPESAYKLVSVTVTGSDRYKPEDFTAAMNMQIGQTVHEQDFKDASRSLGDSGAFSEIAYSFDYSPEGTKLEWRVKDSSHFAPARFENFVWYSDQALIELIHSSVPLFHGELPARGRMADQVSEALQAMLAQRNIPGNVDYIRAGPEDGPPEAFVYSVAGLHITIRKVEVAGAAPEDLSLLKDAAEKLEGNDYIRSVLRSRVDKMFLPVYLKRGYLKASFIGPETKLVQSEDREISVDVSFAVSPGKQYTVSQIDLSGNKALSHETLDKLLNVKAGQSANTIQLANDLDTMKQVYGSHGYMAAEIKLQPEVNDAQATVRYVVNITEGDAYKMGDLEIRGLDEKTTSRIQNEWTLHPGDTYDSGYSQRFLTQVYKEIGDWNVKVDESQNPDHTVDLTLRFESKR